MPETATENAPDQPSRLRDALTARPSRGQGVVAVLLLAVGFAAATQVRSNEQDDQYSSLRQADLIRVFDGLAGSSERAETEIDRLTRTREELLDSSTQRQAALDEARKQAETLSILAGLVPATGPGVRITITDPNGEFDATDMLDVIQELRTAGAEAMEFNDEVRVIAQTSIVSVPGGIELDGVLLETPYVIDVIGSPVALDGALDFPDGPVEEVEDVGGTVTSRTLDKVNIMSVVEGGRLEFAQPGNDQ